MRNHKFHLQLTGYYDLEGLDKHLETKAAQGWMLEKISLLGWRYRRMEPKRLRFSVTYQNTFSVWDAKDDEEQQAYRDLCRQSGWTLAASQGPVQVFYTEDDDAPPLETDPQMVFRVMDRLSRTSVINSIVLFFASMLNGSNLLWYVRRCPIDALASPIKLLVAVSWVLICLYCVLDVVTYSLWRHKAKGAAAMGEFVYARSISTPVQIIWDVFVMGMLYVLLATLWPDHRAIWAVAAAVLGLLLLAPMLLRRRPNMRWVVPANAVTSLLIIGLFALCFTILLMGEPSLDAPRYDPDPPLTAADLTGEDLPGYSRRVELEDSILVRRTTCDEWSDGPSLYYTVGDIQVDAVYDLCKSLLLDPPDGGGFVPLDPVPGVDAVYQDADGYRSYVLCWDTRLVSLISSWALTDAQLETAARLLAP